MQCEITMRLRLHSDSVVPSVQCVLLKLHLAVLLTLLNQPRIWGPTGNLCKEDQARQTLSDNRTQSVFPLSTLYHPVLSTFVQFPSSLFPAFAVTASRDKYGLYRVLALFRKQKYGRRNTRTESQQPDNGISLTSSY